MATAQKLNHEKIKNFLLSNAKCLGNSKRGLKEVCSDLINQALTSGKNVQTLCDMTFLSSVTIERMRTLKEAESGEIYRPQVETCERILRAFGAELTINEVKIKSEYVNKPKVQL